MGINRTVKTKHKEIEGANETKQNISYYVMGQEFETTVDVGAMKQTDIDFIKNKKSLTFEEYRTTICGGADVTPYDCGLSDTPSDEFLEGYLKDDTRKKEMDEKRFEDYRKAKEQATRNDIAQKMKSLGIDYFSLQAHEALEEHPEKSVILYGGYTEKELEDNFMGFSPLETSRWIERRIMELTRSYGEKNLEYIFFEYSPLHEMVSHAIQVTEEYFEEQESKRKKQVDETTIQQKEMIEVNISPSGEPTGNENTEKVSFIGKFIDGEDARFTIEAGAMDADMVKKVMEHKGFNFGDAGDDDSYTIIKSEAYGANE